MFFFVIEGIGYETAMDFAKRGARVILACRDAEKAEDARLKIIEATGNPNVVVRLIDMASFKSVREFAKVIIETEKRLDILINNAGGLRFGNNKSIDGQDMTLQVNYFSHFLLTNLLLGEYTSLLLKLSQIKHLRLFSSLKLL